MKSFRELALPMLGAMLICAGLLLGMAVLVDMPRPAQNALPAAGESAPAVADELELRSEPRSYRSSVPARNIVRSETRTYELPPAAAAGDQDRASYQALQRNCYEAARNNQNGEYPALQQMACNRYTQFAASKGWDAGQLPAYGSEPIPGSVPQLVYRESDRPLPLNECPGLLKEKEGLNARMRQGYYEPEGSRWRERLHVIDQRLWELHCRLT